MILDVEKQGTFELSEHFLAGYHDRPVPWGFGDLSRAAFLRSYSRDGEAWWQTCRRVIEGTVTIQRIHCAAHGLSWDEDGARRQAQEAYERMFSFKWTPPGRGLWIMGTRFMYEHGGAALNNCGFVSTETIERDYAAPFVWLFHMSMLGVGVGFDTRGQGRVEIRPATEGDDVHAVADSREGWAAALERLLSAYTGRGSLPRRWDLAHIRPQGAKLESFGGHAGGPEPLERMLATLRELYDSYAGRTCDARLIVDTMNIVGSCVVAGGVRRSAQIALGSPHDEQFLDLKVDAEKVAEYRWVSNNSVLARAGMDYDQVLRRTIENGEPGFFWLENARRRGRMSDPVDGRDEAALGTNPCGEQTLWDRELCCLVETYPAHHASRRDYLRTLELAYVYAKTVTLVPTEDAVTNEVMAANRRIGCSMTGIVQAIHKHGRGEFFSWCDEGYEHLKHLDAGYARWWRVPLAIKLTSVKPSGTVSLLAGATPGVHWAYAPYYLRRVRVPEDHELAGMCRQAGYQVERDEYSENTVVIAFPVHTGGQERSRREVAVGEQVELAVQMQRRWSDNQVSCTATFDPQREGKALAGLLRQHDEELKAVSLLPWGAESYAQPPYEEISAERYRELTAHLEPLRGPMRHEPEQEPRFCESDVCRIP